VSGSEIQRNQLWLGNANPHYPTVVTLELVEVLLEEAIEMIGRTAVKPFPGQLLHVSIVGHLGMRMDVTAAPVTTKIAVKTGADMPELVKNSAELLLKFFVHEAWKVETKNIEHLMAAGIEQLLAGIPATAAHTAQGSILKTHRCK
jgi:hypothetical protein